MKKPRKIVSGPWSLAAVAVAISCGGREPQREPQSDTPESAPPAAAPRVVAKPLPDSAFQVEWGVPEPSVPSMMRVGQRMAFSITVKNTSDQTWPDPIRAGSPGGAYSVRLGYRWLARTKRLAIIDYSDRIDLPKAVAPGESATLSIQTVAPTDPGEYRLQFDLVQELSAWFEGKGAAKLIFPITVQGS